MDRYNKYQTKQLHAHTYTCTHNSWWLVLGWVNTKEYHPRLCIDYVDFMARYKCNYIYINILMIISTAVKELSKIISCLLSNFQAQSSSSHDYCQTLCISI